MLFLLRVKILCKMKDPSSSSEKFCVRAEFGKEDEGLLHIDQ